MKKKIAAFVLTGITIIGLSSAQVYAMGGGMGGGMGSSMINGIMGSSMMSGIMGNNQSGRSSGQYGYMHGGRSGNQYMNGEYHYEMMNQIMGNAAGYMGVRPTTDPGQGSQRHKSNGNASRWHMDQIGSRNNR